VPERASMRGMSDDALKNQPAPSTLVPALGPDGLPVQVETAEQPPTEPTPVHVDVDVTVEQPAEPGAQPAHPTESTPPSEQGDED
jgi:hypothetical protein